MKKFVQALFLVFCAIALGVAVYFYISTRSGRAEASRPVATRQLELRSGADAAGEREAAAEREAATNRISALPNEVVLDVVTVNLDQDEGDEQILIVRKTDKAESLLSVVVADYLPQRRAWIRAWEGETLATKLTTFSIQVRDVLGDHNLAIVCTGINDSNEQTVTVFRRIPGSDPSVLSYALVCAVAADAVVVEELERTEGYQLGQVNGVSWPVVAYRSDKESQNFLDQVKTTYAWDFRKGSYVESGSEKITGAEVERGMAAKVLTGVEKDFEAYLTGVWEAAAPASSGPGARLLVFDRPGDTITFFSSDAQEVFHWNESHSTRYGLYVGCQNESVSNLRRLMDIELTGADAISVRIFEDVQMKVDAEKRWDGSYRKLPPGSGGRPEAEARREAPLKLEGIYRSADGAELVFEGSRFTLSKGQTVERGGFVAYSLGRDSVLELTSLKESGLVSSRRIYRAAFAETRNGRSISRKLRLSPARAAISGLELLEEPELSFEQKIGD